MKRAWVDERLRERQWWGLKYGRRNLRHAELSREDVRHSVCGEELCRLPWLWQEMLVGKDRNLWGHELLFMQR